jgi:hypothetical protein
VAGEQSLDPPCRERRDRGERLGSVNGFLVDRRHKISYLN